MASDTDMACLLCLNAQPEDRLVLVVIAHARFNAPAAYRICTDCVREVTRAVQAVRKAPAEGKVGTKS